MSDSKLGRYLASYVEWAAGEPHDEDLDQIIRFLIPDRQGKRDTFSLEQWRKGHRQFWEISPKVKAAWTRAAKAGIIQEPTLHFRQPGGWAVRRDRGLGGP
jgi:hypothetical protein